MNSWLDWVLFLVVGVFPVAVMACYIYESFKDNIAARRSKLTVEEEYEIAYEKGWNDAIKFIKAAKEEKHTSGE